MHQAPQSKPLTTEQVVGRLLESAGGQIVACNIVAGIENGLVDPAWAKSVLAWMGEIGAHEDYAEPAGFVRALDDLRTHRCSPTALSTTPPDIRLGGVDAPASFKVEVSCVVPAWWLDEVVLHQDKQRLAREGLILPQSSSEVLAAATVDEWRDKPAHARVVRFDPASALGDQHSVVWFTRRGALEDALAAEPPSTHAQRARDLLGLVHRHEGTVLAAMHFQPSTLSACASARPTFADAGSHARFKTWPDSMAARNARSWGRTVDLRALDASHASLDGCPERIVASTDGGALSNRATFEFELLGTIRQPSQGSVSDAAFVQRLLSGRTVTELATELKTLNN